MEEILKWWWKYYISKKEIENMKKVPIIQKKSELYHKNQDKEADLFINKSLENIDAQEDKISIIKNIDWYWNKLWLRNKLIYRIKNLLFKTP